MTLKAALLTPRPALVCRVKRAGKNPYVIAIIAASFLLLSGKVGLAEQTGGGTAAIPNQYGVAPFGLGFTPGPTGSCSISDPTCADRYQATFTISGTVYGTMVAPPPSISNFGVNCATTQCSNGIKQNNYVGNVLYANYPDLCRFVDNNNLNSGSALFVPQGSAQEFAAFINHAPVGVGFGYCTLGKNYSYTATASFPTDFYITATGGPASSTVGGAVQPTVTPLPTTRVTNPVSLAPNPPQTVTF